ncbi:argininosuccinate lyase [Actinophytocola xinjiangensis]|uniref:Argininosuccinate lyase n=1 Tax=Actinophytocola xinjiangensis TaxID=485602 RepID=A0A7Z0WSY6_9PSEU|nr:argininosuccinate lyase [Actinophytocola xinjiangensis]OLF14249.1 argininosuccinate lyase [Actinophytocola xinjiangensis]
MSQKLWAGRFENDITADVLDYTLTTDVDVRLITYDLWQSMAHNLMLGRSGVVSAEHVRAILAALLELAGEHQAGELALRPALEDVHLNLETMVIERAGADAGGRMHTARSRNDQVVTDTRMYLRQQILLLVGELSELVADLCAMAAGELEHIIPGYTHGQPAQPISVAFWRLGHAAAFVRDIDRLRDAYRRINECPLGAGALAGTSFPIDRSMTARLLGFDRPMGNALDATSARDFTQEVAACLAITATHHTRLAEEVVLWNSQEYGLVTVHDSVATGSSIMPQKKNPVVAELARARAGRAYGPLVQLLVMAKSVGLGYSCDLQEDKPLLWQAVDSVRATTRLMHVQVRKMVINHDRGRDICYENFSTATELANHLVAEHDQPFRTAHRITGEIVGELTRQDRTLRDTAEVVRLLAEQGVDTTHDTIAETVSPVVAMRRNTSVGGTAPGPTADVCRDLDAAAKQAAGWCQERQRELDDAHEGLLTQVNEFIAGTRV